MDTLNKLSLEAKIVLGSAVLYLLVSFLDWQQVSFLSAHAGISEWHGIGVIAGLLVLALLAWEGARLAGTELNFGPITAGLGSLGLALLLLVFTVLTFLTHNEARHWPSWVGLLLSIVITFAAVRRGQTEGVSVRDFGTMKSGPASPAQANTAEPTTTATAEAPVDEAPETGTQTET